MQRTRLIDRASGHSRSHGSLNDLDPAILAESLCVGHTEIDAQHKELFQIASEALKPNPDQELITRLQDYIESHFKWENELMFRLEIKDDHHLADHLSLMQETSKLKSGDRHSFPERIRPLLFRWLLTHIRTHDRRLSELVKKRELCPNS